MVMTTVKESNRLLLDSSFNGPTITLIHNDIFVANCDIGSTLINREIKYNLDYYSFNCYQTL